MKKAPLFFLFLFSLTLAWWNPDWQYRVPVTLESNGTKTNSVAQIVIDTQQLILANKMKPDCSDVRFVDSDDETELKYFVWGCNSNVTLFLVSVPYVSSGKTIYLYYGNPSASGVSQISQSFDFANYFTDFCSFPEWLGAKKYASGINLNYGCSNCELYVSGGGGIAWENYWVHLYIYFKTAIPKNTSFLIAIKKWSGSGVSFGYGVYPIADDLVGCRIKANSTFFYDGVHNKFYCYDLDSGEVYSQGDISPKSENVLAKLRFSASVSKGHSWSYYATIDDLGIVFPDSFLKTLGAEETYTQPITEKPPEEVKKELKWIIPLVVLVGAGIIIFVLLEEV